MNNGPEWMDENGMETEQRMGGREPVGPTNASEGTDGLERDLALALRHTDAPVGFADRVMARALSGDWPGALERPGILERPGAVASAQGRLLTWPQNRAWMAGAVAAMLALVVTFAGDTAFHVHRQHERAQTATRNFELATQIEEQALEHTRQQLRQAGVLLEH